MVFHQLVARAHLVLLLILINGSFVHALSLSDMQHGLYSSFQPVPVHVNVVTSVRTHLPYDYYTAFPTCHPNVQIEQNTDNIGGIFLGNRIQTSPYEGIKMLKDFTCEIICEKRIQDKKQRVFLINAIEREYRINLLLDGLPLLEREGISKYVQGISLGYREEGVVFLNNHIHFTITYTTEEMKGINGKVVTRYRILSFVGKPYSLDHKANHTSKTLVGEKALSSFSPLPITTDSITWSYGVSWVRSTSKWTSMWDMYLNLQQQKIRLYSVIESTFFFMFLSLLILGSLFRAIRRDLGKMHRAEPEDADLMDLAGWKSLSRDVFRPPSNCWLLACFTGAGMQLVGVVLTVLVFSSLGMLSSPYQGSFLTAVFVSFLFWGLCAGYVSARFLKLWNATRWKYVFATGSVVPAIVFGIFLVINVLIWSQSSSAAVPLISLSAVVGMWFFVHMPLVFVGAIWGFKRSTILLPSPYNQIPRHVPIQPWYVSKTAILFSGAPPFTAILLEVNFILEALWVNKLYYVFGFLLLIPIILLLTTSEVAVTVVYMSLCAEDYRWWWRGFFVGASSGVFLFMYSVFCVFFGYLPIGGGIPMVIYLGYMLLISFLFSVATGSAGFIASFFFVHRIYRFIKAD